MKNQTKLISSVAVCALVLFSVGCNKDTPVNPSPPSGGVSNPQSTPSPTPIPTPTPGCSTPDECSLLNSPAAIVRAAEWGGYGICTLDSRGATSNLKSLAIDGTWVTLIRGTFYPTDPEDPTAVIDGDQQSFYTPLKLAIDAGECFYPTAGQANAFYTYAQLYALAFNGNLGDCTIALRGGSNNLASVLIAGQWVYVDAYGQANPVSQTNTDAVKDIVDISVDLATVYDQGQCNVPNDIVIHRVLQRAKATRATPSVSRATIAQTIAHEPKMTAALLKQAIQNHRQTTRAKKVSALKTF